MSNESILIVEDDADIRELVTFTLSKEGYKITSCDSAEEAETHLSRNIPDLIILDLMLPGKDGFEFCRTISVKEKTANIPIIMVTAREEDADVVAGLEIGADDYVLKPFSPRVLAARVKAVLRRRNIELCDNADIVKRGVFEIDTVHHEVKIKGKRLDLTLSEFKALEMFARRPGVVFSRYQIVDTVHGSDYPVTDRSVDVLLVGLRKKLGPFGDTIETVRGVGYRMKE